ncbi:MAG: dihydroorotate dehydrogenase-like protein [Candidatus Aminicenantes bacterium]|nr:dihydroorotate dehydrogenase-like protein [Candidatus Aminicenantes bacterium]
MPDLITSYMGLKLSNPIIVGSCDLTGSVSGILRCEEAGAGAVVLKSIFEEQFMLKEDILAKNVSLHPEAVDYLRKGGLLEYAPQKMCQMIIEAKKKTKIPIIASINCQSIKLWPSFAKQFQEAGADGLELNIYFLPLELKTPGSKYEESYIKILREIKNTVSIPVAVKLTAQITSVPYLAHKLAESGCDAIVLFNWFLEPDINIKNLKTRNILGKGNFNQSLRWIALLADRIDCDLVSSGGLKNGKDLIKQILAGASAVQACTLFYQKGLKVIKDVLAELVAWMKEHHYKEIEDFRGELSFKTQELSFKDMGEADVYFRAQYIKAYKKFGDSIF